MPLPQAGHCLVRGGRSTRFWPFSPVDPPCPLLGVLGGAGLGMMTTEVQLLALVHAEDVICWAWAVRLRVHLLSRAGSIPNEEFLTPTHIEVQGATVGPKWRGVLPPNCSQHGFWVSWVCLGFWAGLTGADRPPAPPQGYVRVGGWVGGWVSWG